MPKNSFRRQFLGVLNGTVLNGEAKATNKTRKDPPKQTF
jgi:hypothetical protein